MTKSLLKPIELANMYAKFYVEDFAAQVMGHLKGSHGLSDDLRQKLVAKKLDELSAKPLEIANTNAVGRFLFECAEFALENFADVEGRETWDAVSALPSVHTHELNTIAYASAELYRTTIDKTVMGTIARDADTTAKLIAQAAQSRTSLQETGGTFNLFNWGLLNDGLWLNNALMRASDRAHIYKPDATPQVGWHKQAFTAAHLTAKAKPLSPDERLIANAEVNLLLGQCSSEALDPLLKVVSQLELEDLLFKVGSMERHLDGWEQGYHNTKVLMSSVEELSVLSQLLTMLQDSSSVQSDETLVGDLVRNRINQAQESVTLALVGIQALRDTRFADALIMRVEGEGTDPKVDVFVNADTIGQFHAAHGEDSDLVRFGFHLDPRQGMPASSTGWSLSYVLDRRDNVLSTVMAEETERLERLRANDAAVIQAEAQRITTEIVQSYLAARQVDELPRSFQQEIGKISREITSSEPAMQLDERMTLLLADAVGDPFVQKATRTLIDNLKVADMTQHASTAAIVDLAVSDAVDYIASIV